MLSGFRAPEDHEWLEPIFAYFKVVTRLVTIVTICGVILLTVRSQPERGLQSAKFFLPLGLFCGFAMVSTLWSPLKSETLGQAGSLLTLVLFSYAISLLVRTPDDFRNLIAWLMVLLIFICLILLVTGLLLPQTGHMTRDGEGLGHATYSGSTGALAVLILILSCLLSSWRWPRIIFLIGMPILCAVILISANRLSMAITSLLIGFAICLLGSRYITAGLLVCIGISGTLFLMIDSDFGSIQESTEYLSRDQSSEEIGSLSGRSSMWEIMWASFMESPVIGHGYFVTSSTGELYMWYSARNWTAHNVVLQVLVTTGIVGTALWAVGLAVPTIVFAITSAVTGSHRRLKWFIAFIFAWYFLWGILNESIMGPVQPESIVFFAIFGTMVGAMVTEEAFFRPENSPAEPKHLRKD